LHLTCRNGLIRCMTNKARKAVENERGLFEKIIGSGVWWIRFTDSQGRYRREKVGRRADAKTLLDKRRTEALQRKKLPEKFRGKAITFRQLCEDALGNLCTSLHCLS
jgi:hypothetical protein